MTDVKSIVTPFTKKNFIVSGNPASVLGFRGRDKNVKAHAVNMGGGDKRVQPTFAGVAAGFDSTAFCARGQFYRSNQPERAGR